MGGLVLVAALVGAAVGSFLNVVIHRVPLHESVVRPGSRCPACRTPLLRRDNVPVLSWLLLRGRCRHCGAPISVRYPLVELGTALLFGIVAGRFAP
jgi:leader peptidase (prepilin peptidase)/N-methyltransferase